MNIVIPIDLVYLLPWDDPLRVAWLVFANGGWVVLLLLILLYVEHKLIPKWLAARRTKFFNQWSWTLLTIRIPRGNEQLPKAVEHIFASLSGAWKRVDWIEKYWLGKVQSEFSFEIVSRYGSLEFLVRTPRQYRDLVEAAVYAQYPDAEISETIDYSEPYVDLQWPDHDGGYDIWGAEFSLVKEYFYPIKTWEQFGDKPEGFQDPVYTMLENMSRLGPGEEFWFQICVSPTNNNWQIEGDKFVKKLMGKTPTAKPTLATKSVQAMNQLVSMVIYSIIPPWEKKDSDKKEIKKDEMISREQEVIKTMQTKISKIGFYARLRAVYIARKEVFNKSKVKEGFLGALHQYTDLYSNGLVQDASSKVSGSHIYYQRNKKIAKRKNAILKNYHGRSMRKKSEFGTGPIFSVEELASLWHFPLGSLKALIIKKAEAMKAEAPFGLPMDENMLAHEEVIGFSDDDESAIISTQPQTNSYTQPLVAKEEQIAFEHDDNDGQPSMLPSVATKNSDSKHEPPADLPIADE